jgi:hypothetical protein
LNTSLSKKVTKSSMPSTMAAIPMGNQTPRIVGTPQESGTGIEHP